MALLRRIPFYFEVLSLDICIGVIGSAALAKVVMNATMKPVWWFLLPASVWVIYTADHLLDARRVGGDAVNQRHKFHFDHFRPLVIIASLLAAVCAACAFVFLRDIVLIGGLVLIGLAAFHVIVAYWGKIRFGKEISVAVIYTCGVWFAPFLNRKSPEIGLQIFAASLVFIAALLNLFMTSVIELNTDKRENQVFGMQNFPQETIRKGVIILSRLAAIAVCCFCAFFIASGQADRRIIACSAYLFVLCFVPGIILSYETFFAENRRYRLPAEWVFATGIFLLFAETG